MFSIEVQTFYAVKLEVVFKFTLLVNQTNSRHTRERYYYFHECARFNTAVDIHQKLRVAAKRPHLLYRFDDKNFGKILYS